MITTTDELVIVKEKFIIWNSQFTGAKAPRFHGTSTFKPTGIINTFWKKIHPTKIDSSFAYRPRKKSQLNLYFNLEIKHNAQ